MRGAASRHGHAPLGRSGQSFPGSLWLTCVRKRSARPTVTMLSPRSASGPGSRITCGYRASLGAAVLPSRKMRISVVARFETGVTVRADVLIVNCGCQPLPLGKIASVTRWDFTWLDHLSRSPGGCRDVIFIEPVCDLEHRQSVVDNP